MMLKNEAENEKALAIVEELMHRCDRTPEEDELYELLVVLIEKFEQTYYEPGKTATPHSVLQFLLEQHQLNPTDLVGLLGSQEVVTEVIQGQKELNKSQAIILGKFFHVDSSLFLS